VTAEVTHSGTAHLMLDGKPVGNLSRPDASCLSLPIYQNVPGHTCFASADHPVVILASKRKSREHDVGNKQADMLTVQAGGLEVSIYTSKATKFAAKAAQARYMHLNFQLPGGIPKGAKGIFAEIAGAAPMSAATQAMVKSGPAPKIATGAKKLGVGTVSENNTGVTLVSAGDVLGSELFGSDMD